MDKTLGFVASDWRAHSSGSLIGFVTITMPSGMGLRGVCVHRSAHGRCWATPPASPKLDANGMAERDGRGRVVYHRAIFFTGDRERDWSEQVCRAVHRA